MIDRRGFLKLGAAVTGALVSRGGTAYGAVRIRRPGSLVRGIFDSRFVDSVTFADGLQAHGVTTASVCGDIARLWYDDLRPCVQDTPGPIAGLTDRAVLFCLEELARDLGMQVAIRVDHLMDRGAYVRHDAIGPVSLVKTTQALDPRTGFGRIMAVLASEFALNGSRDIKAQKRTGPSAPADMTALATWVIT